MTQAISEPTPRAPTLHSAPDTSFFGHPRGLMTLFFTEIWERFSYYGMRAILILFMTTSLAAGGLGFNASQAGAIYGIYVSLVYLLSLPGGWIADRILGARRSVLVGGIVIMCGHICLAVPMLPTFYAGLGMIVIGTGLLKPNISTMVGQLYGPSDARRDAGFSIFYMGINIGAFVSPLVCGWLAQSDGFRHFLAGFGLTPEHAWHFGFGAAAVGMFLGVVQYALGSRHLGGAGLLPTAPEAVADRAGEKRKLFIGIAVVAGLLLLFGGLVFSGTVHTSAEQVSDGFGLFLTVVVVGFFGWGFFLAKWSPVERRRFMVIFVLFIASTIFWAGFEQAGSTLNLFAARDTDDHFLGFKYEASWLQSPQSAFIVALAPVFAWLWLKLGRRDPSSPTKFALGLAFMGLGFLILVPAAQISAGGTKVSPMWLVTTYLLHTFGELCLSPVGLSAYTRLAPARVASLMMGVWFLTISVGGYIGGRVAGLYESFPVSGLFAICAATGLVSAIALAFLVRPIRRMLERPS
ncbi:MAG TPA: peptide MFS transporter [Planctomycetota bacterium]|jgi:POT family proton-dependent oligopeptide transporter|nr:peptide MFS transporter [Planctomycetota bacterium]